MNLLGIRSSNIKKGQTRASESECATRNVAAPRHRAHESERTTESVSSRLRAGALHATENVSSPRRAGAVGAALRVDARLRSRRRAPCGAPVSAGRLITSALCAGGALFLSACSGETSCVEDRTCPAGAAGTGGSDGGGVAAGGGSGVGNGGASGTSGAGGAAGSGGKGGTEGGAGASIDAGDAGREAEAGPRCDGGPGQVIGGCAIEDPDGIFVSRIGHASTGDGSRANPFTSINAAIKAASAPGDGGSRDSGSGDGGRVVNKRIYVCANGGVYAETITLDATKNAAIDGLAFLGGFGCADWKYDPAVRTKLASPSLTAWTVSGVVNGIAIEDFEIDSADATISQTSSIAMIVNQSSKNVVLRRVKITAGKGSEGDTGENGGPGSDGLAVGPVQTGQPAVCVNPPTNQAPGQWVPVLNMPYGGKGGPGWINGYGDNGLNGIPTTNVTPPAINNGGASGIFPENGGNGSRGNDGPGGIGPSIKNTFAPAGYTTGAGAQGFDGYPGQGGGGGGASQGTTSCCAASGGAGGCGGLGGHFGTGGWNGGASVGLHIWYSAVTLDQVTLVAGSGGTGGNGGNGGPGGKGQPGAAGGQGNLSYGVMPAGGGGKGGDGGTGGSGAGGNGGRSYPLVFHGTPPTKLEVVYTPGQAGFPGAGGFTTGPNGVIRAPDGAQGEAAAEYEAP